MKLHCFLTRNNIFSFIAIKHYHFPNTVLYCYEDSYEPFHLTAFKLYLRRHGVKNIEIIKIKSTQDSLLIDQISNLTSQDVVIIPNRHAAWHLDILLLTQDKTCIVHYIDDYGQIHQLNGSHFIKLEKNDSDLSVEDFITNSSGVIQYSNSDCFNSDAGNELLDHILAHQTLFTHIFKTIRPLRNSNDSSNAHRVIVDLQKLNPEEKQVYLKALLILENHHIISVDKKRTPMEVVFHEKHFRDYLSKSGTWFEHLTERTLSHISGIDGLESSVAFIWDDSSQRVRNEIDVMAIYNNRLVVISCKDTHSLDEDYLYELESHADALGREGAIKIVATTATTDSFIANRANLLDVHIVQFSHSVEKFKKDMEEAIKMGLS